MRELYCATMLQKDSFTVTKFMSSASQISGAGELPGLVEGKERENQVGGVTEWMKIARRYERLRQPEAGTIARGGHFHPLK
jgi:hypothetical protein